MFERLRAAMRSAAKKPVAFPPSSDLRLPTRLSVGLFGAPSDRQTSAAAALGRAIRTDALARWPEILCDDETLETIWLPREPRRADCDFILLTDADQHGEAEALVGSGLDCAFVGLRSMVDGEQAVLYGVARDDEDRPRLTEQDGEEAIHAVAARLFRPPAVGRGGERLLELLEEGPPRPGRRVEYNFLLRLLGPRAGPPARPSPEPWSDAERFFAGDETTAAEYSRLRRVYDYANGHAVYYGDSWRSIGVTRSGLLLAPTVLSGAIGILAPHLSSLTALAQVVILMCIFFDRRRAGRERWQDKWFDYRDVAERLRCLRYVWLCDAIDDAPDLHAKANWTSWYVARTARSLTRRPLEAAACAEIWEHLLEAEIRPQIAYHRGVVRRFYALDMKLRLLARGILLFSAGIGCLFVILGFVRFGLGGVPWPVLTGLGLTFAPAIVANLNGFRGEFDLVRQGERSARAAAGLSRIVRESSTRPPTPAMLRRVAADAAHIMIGDATVWRNTLELRAARLKRR
jgi:hypothetical protein